MFDKDNPIPPKFKYQLRNQLELKETERAIFETRLVPIGDPEMTVEWYKDGNLLSAGRGGHKISQMYLLSRMLWLRLFMYWNTS